MPKKGFNGNLGLRCDPQMTDTLLSIERTHRIAPVDLTRGLLEHACQFYREHGWFSFPVVILPEAFQASYVAEEQAAYDMIKPEEKKKKG